MNKVSKGIVVAKEPFNDWGGLPHIRLDIGTKLNDLSSVDAHLYVKPTHPLAKLKVGAEIKLAGRGR